LGHVKWLRNRVGPYGKKLVIFVADMEEAGLFPYFRLFERYSHCVNLRFCCLHGTKITIRHNSCKCQYINCKHYANFLLELNSPPDDLALYHKNPTLLKQSHQLFPRHRTSKNHDNPIKQQSSLYGARASPHRVETNVISSPQHARGPVSCETGAQSRIQERNPVGKEGSSLIKEYLLMGLTRRLRLRRAVDRGRQNLTSASGPRSRQLRQLAESGP